VVQHQFVLVARAEAVLPVAQEREVVVGQPVQQLDRVGDVLVWYRQSRACQLVGEGQGLVSHHRPVVHDAAHVGEYLRHPVAHGPKPQLVGDAVDLDAYPALDDIARLGIVGFHIRPRLTQRAQRVAPYHHDRVHEQVDLQVPGGQRTGDGLHQEGHVVGHDLQYRVVALRAAGRAQPRLAGRPVLAQLTVGQRRRDEVFGSTPDHVLIGHEPPEPRDQRGQLDTAGPVRPRELDSLDDQAFSVRSRLIQLGAFQAGVDDDIDHVPSCGRLHAYLHDYYSL